MKLMLNMVSIYKPHMEFCVIKRAVFSGLFLAFAFLLAGCGGGSGGGGASASNNNLHSGLVQKGPFVSGGIVTVQELDDHLIPIGGQYVSKISTDIGSYVVKHAILSRYVSVSASGYFFDEVKNDISSDPIT